MNGTCGWEGKGRQGKQEFSDVHQEDDLLSW